MVKIHSGLWEVVWLPKKTSQAFSKGQFVDFVTGAVQPSTSSTVNILGVNQDTLVTSASSDYAAATKIPVYVPKGKRSVVQVETSAVVTGGSEYDLTDSNTVDAAASTNDTVRALKALSDTLAIVVINKPALV